MQFPHRVYLISSQVYEVTSNVLKRVSIDTAIALIILRLTPFDALQKQFLHPRLRHVIRRFLYTIPRFYTVMNLAQTS